MVFLRFLAGYLTLAIKKLCSGMPQALEGLKPTLIYPVLSVTVTGLLMIYVINPPASWLNNTLLNGLESLSNFTKHNVTWFSCWCNDGHYGWSVNRLLMYSL